MDKQKLIEDLTYALTHHDWYYGYSDDMSYWRKGNESQRRINAAHKALAEIDKELADKLYAEHRPAKASY